MSSSHNRSKLLKLRFKNLGCVGNDWVEIRLDDVVCLVGKNNSGKSTVLRAYEIAHTPSLFNPNLDKCNYSGDESTFVEIEVHIPEGIGNIDEKWKEKIGKNLVLKSQWEWGINGFIKRRTWNPDIEDWSEDENAGGADNVFKSRLPRPLRIGSLEDASGTESTLLALTLSSLKNRLVQEQTDPESKINQSILNLVSAVNSIGEDNKSHFDSVSEKVQSGFCGIFPGLNVDIKISMKEPNIKIDKLLEEGSGIIIKDGENTTSLSQQGAGARRALFWAMLQVHNDLKISEEKTKKKNKKKNETDENNDPALPGYLLLIDEPENALHPIAARAAQRHLYKLSEDPDWQIIMTTHSPYFVNPFEDHTTIVRVDKTIRKEITPPSILIETKTYTSDDVIFSEDEKEDLQALQHMDADFSEVFFGSFPILVEGDTEHAAFISAVINNKNELQNKITVIRARGKAILVCLIKMLRHFKLPFGIIHDVDWPSNVSKSGDDIKIRTNSMWTVNDTIYKEIELCRKSGISVSYMCSLPDFERELGGAATSKDKPLAAYKKIERDDHLKSIIISKLEELSSGENSNPFKYDEKSDGDFRKFLHNKLTEWCNDNNCLNDPRLQIK